MNWHVVLMCWVCLGAVIGLVAVVYAIMWVLEQIILAIGEACGIPACMLIVFALCSLAAVLVL